MENKKYKLLVDDAIVSAVYCRSLINTSSCGDGAGSWCDGAGSFLHFIT